MKIENRKLKNTREHRFQAPPNWVKMRFPHSNLHFSIFNFQFAIYL